MRKSNIPFIHNYCDRWCERCPFTDRCAVFEEEQKLAPEAKDINNDAFWERLSDNFKKTLDMLNQMAAEMGIDLEAAAAEQAELSRPGEAASEAEKVSEKSETARQAEQLTRRTERYIKQVDRFFDQNQDFFEEKQTELEHRIQLELPIDPEALEGLKSAFEIIRFYQFFISAKTQRSLSGLEYDNEFEIDDPEDLQSDSNGSAKIALIAIERSLASWETVRENFPEKTDELLDVFVSLQRMQKGLLEFFPRAMSFVRPGFDEPEHQPKKARAEAA